MEESPKEEKKVHQPEFIILEAEEEQGTQVPDQHLEYLSFINKLSKKKFSFALRIFILLSAIFVLAAIFFVAAFMILTIFFAALGLFRSPELNRNMFKSWGYLKKTVVIFIGLFLSLFSPALGLSLILFYLMTHGERLNKSFINKFFFKNK